MTTGISGKYEFRETYLPGPEEPGVKDLHVGSGEMQQTSLGSCIPIGGILPIVTVSTVGRRETNTVQEQSAIVPAVTPFPRDTDSIVCTTLKNSAIPTLEMRKRRATTVLTLS